MKAIPTVYLLAGGAVLAALAYVALKGPAAVGADIGGAAVDMVDGVLSGAVVRVGEKVGVPQTNVSACDRAIAEGRTWDASFACPAGRFLGYLWD